MAEFNREAPGQRAILNTWQKKEKKFELSTPLNPKGKGGGMKVKKSPVHSPP